MDHIIWTSEVDYKDWRADLEEQYPDSEGYNESKRIEIMCDTNNDYLTDEVFMLNKELGRQIVCIGDLGLWNGRAGAHKYQGTNLNSIFSGTCGDLVTWYVDGEDIKCKDVHHDGTNYYTYRLLKPDIETYEFDDYVFDNTLEKAVKEYTEPIGHYAAEIYGWEE